MLYSFKCNSVCTSCGSEDALEIDVIDSRKKSGIISIVSWYAFLLILFLPITEQICGNQVCFLKIVYDIQKNRIKINLNHHIVINHHLLSLRKHPRLPASTTPTFSNCDNCKTSFLLLFAIRNQGTHRHWEYPRLPASTTPTFSLFIISEFNRGPSSASPGFWK